MKTIAIIPARYGSSRFPGKPLADIGGKPMVRRVYEQVSRCALVDAVFVATDDERIARCVEDFGGKACMTSPELPNGTSRCWQAYQKVVRSIGRFDVLLNVQGDEPFIEPQALVSLLELFNDRAVGIATLKKKISLPEELFDANVVKVLSGKDGKAACFSRFPLPFQRDLPFERDRETALRWMERADYFKHVGIYAFRPEVLTDLVELPSGKWEEAEKLEQLRWMENGYVVHVRETAYESLSVDTPSDIRKIMDVKGC